MVPWMMGGSCPNARPRCRGRRDRSWTRSSRTRLRSGATSRGASPPARGARAARRSAGSTGRSAAARAPGRRTCAACAGPTCAWRGSARTARRRRGPTPARRPPTTARRDRCGADPRTKSRRTPLRRRTGWAGTPWSSPRMYHRRAGPAPSRVQRPGAGPLYEPEGRARAPGLVSREDVVRVGRMAPAVEDLRPEEPVRWLGDERRVRAEPDRRPGDLGEVVARPATPLDLVVHAEVHERVELEPATPLLEHERDEPPARLGRAEHLLERRAIGFRVEGAIGGDEPGRVPDLHRGGGGEQDCREPPAGDRDRGQGEEREERQGARVDVPGVAQADRRREGGGEDHRRERRPAPPPPRPQAG